MPGGPPGIATSYRFEYRQLGAPAWTALPTQDVFLGDGTDPVAVSQHATGLQAGVPYEARLVASREFGAGEAIAGPEAFVPGDLPPAVTTANPKRTDTAATLTGVIDANNKPTTYFFEWGEGSAGPYQHRVPVPDGVLPAGEGPRLVAEPIDGLEPDTAYHYRLVADNGVPVEPSCDPETEACDTEVEGADVAFTTRGAVADLPGRAYEMVTAPFKPVRATTGFGARVRNNPTTGVPSLDGDAIAWQVPFFPLGDDVGYPANTDRRIED